MQTATNSFFELIQYFTKEMRSHPRSQGEFDEGIVRRRLLRDQSYFFDRVVRQNDADFESFHIRREIRKAVSENADRLAKALKEKIEGIIPFPEIIENLVPDAKLLSERVLFDYEGPSEYYFHKKSSSIVLQTGPSSFCILTRTKDDADGLVKFLKQEFEKLNDVTKDFGLVLEEVLTGRKYQENILRSSGKIQNLQYKEPKNAFEKEIIDFCGQITSSLLPNVEISFVEPIETYECDVFIGVNESIKRIIEPTDYESVRTQMPQGENLKSQVVLRTLDKAQRLGANTVVITKGFPENTFTELKKIAESRGIVLLNEINYRNFLPRIFCGDLLKAFSEPQRFPGFLRGRVLS